MSKEHVVSKSVFSGKSVIAKGMHWCRTEYKEVSRASLTANILCKRHNEALSQVDAEAARFRQAVETLMKNKSPDRRIGAKEHLQLNGRLFTRWLAKTHCNLLTNDKREPGPDWIRFAYGKGTARRITLYFDRAWPGARMRLDDNHPLQFADYSEPNGDTVCEFQVFGIPWLVMDFELERGGSLVLPGRPAPIVQSQLMEEPNEIVFDLGERKCGLVIRWPGRRR